MKKFLFLITLLTFMGGANSVKAETIVTKTPIVLTGGKFSECFTPGTYYIEMNGWQNFTVYEDAIGVAFDENSTMVFDMAEQSNNDQVRVVFTYEDGTTSEIWWCTGIGSSADDPTTQWNHKLDNSTFWLKKGLGANFDSKKDLKITKVTVNNQNVEGGIYKINGGTVCGETMTIKKQGQWYDPTVFGTLGGEFRATAAFSNIFQMKPFEVGDNQKIVIKFGEAVPSTGDWRLNNNSGLTSLSGKTEYEFALDGTAISDFTIFNWDANPDPIKISEVYFYKEEASDIEASEIFEAPVGTFDVKNLTGTNTGWATTVTYPKEFKVQGDAFGDGNGSTEGTHVNIDGYDYICFNVTTATNNTAGLRVWLWDGEPGDGSVVTLYTKPIASYKTADYKTYSKITGVGTYVVNVSGYKYLKGVKAENDYGSSASKVSIAYMCTGDPVAYVPTNKYTLAGEATGSATLTDALADANATFYDATGVTGTDVDLTSVANKNALFKANSGALANTSNVIVGSTCANLALKDGNYPFSAPETFTATSVSFNRTFKAGTRSTVCLPFALTAAEAAEAGTFYELSGTENEGTQLTFTDITASGTTAYKPYIFEANADGAPFTGYSSKEIAETPATFTGTTVEGYTLTGVLTGSTDVAADHAGKKVYGWSGNSGEEEGKFVKVGSGVSIDPFRAYVVYNGSGNNARLAARFVSGSVTGINEVSEAQGFKNFEGKVFENGKIVIYKKGMKFNANGARLK